MADPSLKDVLDAIEALRKSSATREDLARVQGELMAKLASKEDLARVEGRLDALDRKVEKGFADLDAELTRHTAVHRETEKDVTTLKRRPPRTAARPPRRR